MVKNNYREQLLVSAVMMARVREIKEWTTDFQVANHGTAAIMQRIRYNTISINKIIIKPQQSKHQNYEYFGFYRQINVSVCKLQKGEYLISCAVFCKKLLPTRAMDKDS